MSVKAQGFKTGGWIAILGLLCGFCFGGAAGAETGALRIGVLNRPESLNYFGATDVYSRRVLSLLHMPLYIRSPRGGKMVPWLAESQPLMEGPGEKATIRLRKARWDDGSMVTAHDLAFTVKVIQDFKVPGQIEKWEIVKDVEVVDDQTIRFILREASPTFISRTLQTGFVQKTDWEPIIRALKEEKAPLERLLGYRPVRVVGNGPFSMTRAGTTYIQVLKANRSFFASGMDIDGLEVGPYVDALFLILYPDDEEATAALTAGDIDFIWGDVPVHHTPALRHNANITLYRNVRSGYDWIGFNLNRAPFSDRAFRSAISFLVERGQIVRHVLKDEGEPVLSVIPPGNIFWRNPRIQTLGHDLGHEKRLAEARDALARAEYAWSDGALVLPDGNKMARADLLIANAGNRPDRLKTARIIQKWLGALGVSIRMHMEPMDHAMDRLRGNDFDMVLMGWASLPDDPDYLRTFFHSREAEPFGRNTTRFRNTRFDDLAQRAYGEVDPDERRRLVFEMQELIAQELPCIPLYAMTRIEAVRSDAAKGWIGSPAGIGNLWSFLNVRIVRQGNAGVEGE